MLQPYIDRPHQLRNTIVRRRIMKYRIYLLRKSFFQLHCRFSACCDSESNHSVLGHRKNVAEELHGMDSVTGWLPVWRSTLTRMELGKNHGHPATNVSVSSVVLPIGYVLLPICRKDLEESFGMRCDSASGPSFCDALNHFCHDSWSSLTSHSRCPKDKRNHLQQKIYYNIRIQTLPEVRNFTFSLAATLSHMAWYGLFL